VALLRYHGLLVRRLLIATTNADKLREISAVLVNIPFEIVSLANFPEIPAPEENERSFDGNARLKALAYAKVTGELTVAEDSGLEIDALHGAPGVESARYGGAGLSYPKKFDLIYRGLQAKDALDSPARFVCAVALAEDERILFEARGVMEGLIASEPKGDGGFGYDPIFFFPPFGKTLAEVSSADKASVSHRGKAFRELGLYLVTRK